MTKQKQGRAGGSLSPEIHAGPTDKDHQLFLNIISTELTDDQKKVVRTPPDTFPFVKNLLAVHWHPEHVPLELVSARLNGMFPNRVRELVIPTQHNTIMTYDNYAGVEVDCYSRGFNQKVQLLLHFEKERVKKADVLKNMLDHTFKYRSSQLFELIHAFTGPDEKKLDRAARSTGTNREVADFVITNVRKIEKLIDLHSGIIPAVSLKNKLLRNFFEELRDSYPPELIDRSQNFLRAVKKLVKADFSLHHFYRASEVIEEARRFGAGIVVPHPEQFWPILLADYDVDGYEVWNPQSMRYTDFLISVILKKNMEPSAKRKLLIFMGDDTHMGEKIVKPSLRQKEKALREVGVQDGWDDHSVRKRLNKAGIRKESVITEYKERLGG
ncbi:MAG: hypothetical protein R6V41_04655 [Desulfobacteraceae bacterium]